MCYNIYIILDYIYYNLIPFILIYVLIPLLLFLLDIFISKFNLFYNISLILLLPLLKEVRVNLIY